MIFVGLFLLLIGILAIILNNRRKYSIKIRCDNCGTISKTKILKGTTIKNFLQKKEADCKYCGCSVFITYFKPNKDFTVKNN